MLQHARTLLHSTRGSLRTPCISTMHRQMESTWSGAGSQDDFMLQDTCILVNEGDEILGHISKKDCHRFSPSQPGLLHRAFSVFLFDSQNKLLLQQRASSKITFPDVWTNTCCSHPLHGFKPSEVDDLNGVLKGEVPGAKHAAIRKLGHELGIPSEQIPFEKFKYLTRLQYCAADEIKPGAKESWGENEMDYLLFIKADVEVTPNSEEVREHRYVTLGELKSMMAPSSGLKWSPWFRIIAANFLEKWWEDLDSVLNTDKHVDYETIHRLECKI
ncbi:hypothetical protein BSKO_11942 [Bryopsis sp. KO-2023]|nr:hypothetical protein BSKO_11942 [Bryopsis sp. KO-2023]